jgi:sugar O-acyltransferase (sialic acid O-acetyltransferase NeuD family)
MVDRQTYLLGGGGHGQVVLDALLAGGGTVAGIIDPALKPGLRIFDVPVLGGNDALDRLDPAKVKWAMGLGATPRASRRMDLFDACKSKGFIFATVRHVSAEVGRDCVLSEGCQIMAGATLQCRVSVGVNGVINTRASVDHGCHVGDHAFIGPGSVLCGEVHVGIHAFVGAGAIILPSVGVGRGSIVGAGAVVVRSVPDGFIVAGNPAVKIGEYFA